MFHVLAKVAECDSCHFEVLLGHVVVLERLLNCHPIGSCYSSYLSVEKVHLPLSITTDTTVSHSLLTFSIIIQTNIVKFELLKIT